MLEIVQVVNHAPVTEHHGATCDGCSQRPGSTAHYPRTIDVGEDCLFRCERFMQCALMRATRLPGLHAVGRLGGSLGTSSP